MTATPVIVAHESDNLPFPLSDEQLVALDGIGKRSGDDKAQRVSMGVSDGFTGRNVIRFGDANQRRLQLPDLLQCGHNPPLIASWRLIVCSPL
jgi:hypothetical protein